MEWAALIGLLIGAVSSIWTNVSNRQMHKQDVQTSLEEGQRNREFQADQAQNQMDFNEEMYLKYQSPQALVNQYDEAGLNSALMMTGGSHGASGSFPGAMGSGSQASIPSPIAMQSPLDAMTMAQVANLNADTRSKDANTESTNIKNSHLDELLNSEIYNNKASAQQKIAAASLYGMQKEQIETILPLIKQIDELKIQQASKDLMLTDSQISKLNQEIKNLSQQFYNLVEENLKIQAERKLLSAETVQAYAHANLLSQQTVTELKKLDLMDSEMNLNTARFEECYGHICEMAAHENFLDSQSITESVLRDSKLYLNLSQGISNIEGSYTYKNLFGLVPNFQAAGLERSLYGAGGVPTKLPWYRANVPYDENSYKRYLFNSSHR